jgi:hypothetical protein
MQYGSKNHSAPKKKTMPAPGKGRKSAAPSKGKTGYRMAFTRGQSY